MKLIKIVHNWYHLLAPKLDPDVLTEVQHFLDHDEWEMAFEILLINLTDLGLPLP